MRFNKNALITACIFVAGFIPLTIFIFYECRQLATVEAEKNLNNFLLNHRAIHTFVEDIQKQEIYRLKKHGALYQEYFSPILLSFTYIARNMKDALNVEREKHGLDPVYFKLAAKNPRNKINIADAEELELLKLFNAGSLSEYKKVVTRNDEQALYYAIPIAPNKESCMLCHGEPSAAPKEMLQQYGEQSGFNERLGEIRALISVRVPMKGLLNDANRIAWIISSIAFLLLTGVWGSALYFFRQLDLQKKQIEERSYHLNSILQSSSDAIIATDINYNIKYFNTAAEQLLGFLSQRR